MPEDDYTVPFGVAENRRKGARRDYRRLRKNGLRVSRRGNEMERQGISAEVIDPRTLVPMDIETIKDSVLKTGRLVVVDEACPTCGAAAEIASQVVQDETRFAVSGQHRNWSRAWVYRFLTARRWRSTLCRTG